jgi:hypothetical protein
MSGFTQAMGHHTKASFAYAWRCNVALSRATYERRKLRSNGQKAAQWTLAYLIFGGAASLPRLGRWFVAMFVLLYGTLVASVWLIALGVEGIVIGVRKIDWSFLRSVPRVLARPVRINRSI